MLMNKQMTLSFVPESPDPLHTNHHLWELSQRSQPGPEPQPTERCKRGLILHGMAAEINPGPARSMGNKLRLDSSEFAIFSLG